MADAEIRFGPVDDSDPRPPEQPLDRYAITLADEEENPETGLTTLIFRGVTEGIWAHALRYEVDKTTARAIKRYCDNRLKQGQAIYKQELESAFGGQLNN